MNDRDLPPLDPVIVSLLASEKMLVVQPSDVKARAFARAATTAATRSVDPGPLLRKPWIGLRMRIAFATVLRFLSRTLRPKESRRSG